MRVSSGQGKVTERTWEEYHSAWQNRLSIPANPRIIKALEFLSPITGKKILEVGAGTGRDAVFLASLGAEVTVLDFLLPPLLTCRKIAGNHRTTLNHVCGDAFHLPFPAETFDIVFSQGLLEHFRNPELLLVEQKRVCREGGIVAADVPQTFHIYTILKQILQAAGRWIPGWETQFSCRELRRLFLKSGLDPVFSFGDWSRPSLLWKILCFLRGKAFPSPSMEDSQGLASLWKRKWPFLTFLDVGIAARKPASTA